MTKRNSIVFTLAFALFAFVQGAWAVTKSIWLNDGDPTQSLTIDETVDQVEVHAFSTNDEFWGDFDLHGPEGTVYRFWGKVTKGYAYIEGNNLQYLEEDENGFGTNPYVLETKKDVSIFVHNSAVSFDINIQVLNSTKVETETQLNWFLDHGIEKVKLSSNIELDQMITIGNGKTFEIDLNGFTISRRSLTAASANGHVFKVEQGGTLTITDDNANHTGTITGGWANNGGGIYNEGTVTLNNVTITDNKSSGNGGGIYNEGTVTLNNVTITGNKSSGNGGGIFNKGVLKMSGIMNVTGNLRGSGSDNVYLNDGKVITLTGDLQAESKIGVSTVKVPTTITSGGATNSFDLSYFESDRNGELDIENGEVVICAYYVERYVSGNEVKERNKYLKPGECRWLSNYVNSSSLSSGNYLVDVGEIGNRITIPSGNTVRLVLIDGVQVTFKKGIFVAPGTDENISSAGQLYIYGQKDETGKLIAQGGSDQAGIGGNDETGNGLIEIHGGVIQSTGGDYGAGIGTGDEPEDWMSPIYIYGGTVAAQGGTDAAGIGGGNEGQSPKVFIYGGIVNATGGTHGSGIGGGDDSGIYGITISGGTVIAQGGEYGAGIGTGDEAGANSSDAILIKGGTVTATGGPKGAGIGGGNESESPAVTIDGGVVTANGRGEQYAGGAGIGGGDEFPQGGKVTINGGVVTAKGGGIAAAGIGGGGLTSGGGTCGHANKGGEVLITGGKVNVIANVYGAGIGGGDKAMGGAVTITGGELFVEGLWGTPIGESGFSTWFSDCQPDITFGPDIRVASAAYNSDIASFEDSYKEAISSERNTICRTNRHRVWIRSCDHQDGITYFLSLTAPEDDHVEICKWCGHSETKPHLQLQDGTCDICGFKIGAGWWTITLNEATISYSETEMWVTKGMTYTLPEPSAVPEGYGFVGWYLGPMDKMVSGGYMVDPEKISEDEGYLYQPGEEIEVNSNINLVACYNQTNFGAVYIEPYRMYASIDGYYTGTAKVDIQEELVVDTVIFNRDFVKNVASTIVLPFSTTIDKVEGANFYDITNLVIEDGVWHVKTSRLGKDGKNKEIVANKPYLLKPTADGELVFHPNEDGVVLNTSKKQSYTVDGEPSIPGDKWSFRGAYNYFVFGDSTDILGRAYGFSAETDGNIPVGMFVRGGADADIPALRAYLVHEKAPSPIKANFLNNTQLTSASKVNYSLEMPNETVVIDFDDEERTTVIGTLNPVTGQIRMKSADRWFDVQGRLLKGKPTAKGRYFHNGRVEIIK